MADLQYQTQQRTQYTSQSMVAMPPGAKVTAGTTGVQVAYETQQTTTTQSTTQYATQPTRAIRPHYEYLKTIPGILAMGEIVLCLIVVIITSVIWFSGSWWVWWVCMCTFLSVLISFILHFLGVYERMPSRRNMVSFIYYCIFSILLLIASIMAVVAVGSGDPAIGACVFFTFAATAVHCGDTFLQFRSWRSGQSEMMVSTQQAIASPNQLQPAAQDYKMPDSGY